MKRHQFILHVWLEPLDHQQVEWRGRITHIETGKVRFFRNPATLYQVLMELLLDRPEGSLMDKDKL